MLGLTSYTSQSKKTHSLDWLYNTNLTHYLANMDIESDKKNMAIFDEHSTPPSTEGPVMGEVQPKVHFNLFHTLGMNFSITCTPLSVGAYLSLIIGLGGSPFYIWGFLFASVFQLILGLAVAEIASAIPHSSGP